MKKSFIHAKYLYQAKKSSPWACRWAKVEDGWYAFESQADYDTWRRQK